MHAIDYHSFSLDGMQSKVLPFVFTTLWKLLLTWQQGADTRSDKHTIQLPLYLAKSSKVISSILPKITKRRDKKLSNNSHRKKEVRSEIIIMQQKYPWRSKKSSEYQDKL
jgi:hypothetical protein